MRDKVCRNGHDRTLTNALTPNGRCRACKAGRMARWNASPKGREWNRRYHQTPEARADRERYRVSPEGRAARARYNQSPKGIAAQRVARARYNVSLKRHEVSARYNASMKGLLTSIQRGINQRKGRSVEEFLTEAMEPLP